MNDSEPPIQSPCVLVCQIDMEAGHCFGCGRTIDEITAWGSMGHERREAIMETLPARVDALPKREPRATRRRVRQRNRVRTL